MALRTPQVVVSASSVAGGSGGKGASLHVWDPTTGVLLRTFKANQSAPGGLCAIPAKTMGVAGPSPELLMAAQIGRPTLHCWSWAKDQVRFKSSAAEPIRCMVASPDGQWVFAGGVSGKFFAWEVATGKLVRTWAAHYKTVAACVVSRCGSFLVTGGKDSIIHVWTLLDVMHADDRATPAPRTSFSDHTLPITDLAMSAGGSSGRLVSTSLDCSCKVWDIPTSRLLLSIACPTFLTSVAIGPLEMRLFMGGGDGRIFEADLHASATAATTALHEATRDAAGGSRDLQTFSGHSGVVNSLAVSEDGDWLVSASDDGSCRIWDCGSRQQLRSYEGHQGAVSSVLVLAKAPAHTASTAAKPRTLAVTPLRKSLAIGGTGESCTVMLQSGWDAVAVESDEVPEVPVAAPAVAAAPTPAAVAALQAEVARLQGENARWKAVNNQLVALVNAKGGATGAGGGTGAGTSAGAGAGAGAGSGGGQANGSGAKRSRDSTPVADDDAAARAGAGSGKPGTALVGKSPRPSPTKRRKKR